MEEQATSRVAPYSRRPSVNSGGDSHERRTASEPGTNLARFEGLQSLAYDLDASHLS